MWPSLTVQAAVLGPAHVAAALVMRSSRLQQPQPQTAAWLLRALVAWQEVLGQHQELPSSGWGVMWVVMLKALAVSQAALGQQWLMSSSS